MAAHLSERHGPLAPPRSDRLRTLAPPALVAVPFVAATAYIANVDPNAAGHYPTCPSLLITGYYCPGCGGLRAVYALTHGHPLQALHDNAFGLAMMAAVAVCWVAWVVARWRGRSLSTRPILAVTFVLVAVMPVFTVLRNLPIGHFLAP